MRGMDADTAHALIRFGLGRRSGEAPPDEPRGWLRAQLDGPDADLARPAPDIATMLRALAQDRRARRAGGTLPAEAATARALWQEELGAIMANLLATEAPFRERLVWFWANHFTVSTRKGAVMPCLGPYLREAIRPHATGRFVDLLLAVMTHPAMLIYLDNAHSFGPDSPTGQRTHRGLNENLARECLELHTITPAAGYTQADVTAFAAVLTGWSVDLAGERAGFVFRAPAHQPGSQTIMGRRFPPGQQGGIEALTWLGTHPATYRNLARKLSVHFVADDPPPPAVRRIEAALHDTGGDLKAAAAAALDAPEAWQGLGKLRTPFDYVTGALRATGFRPERTQQVAQWQGLLGQPLFAAPLPNGWPDRAADWSGGETLVRRIDWAWAIAGRCPELDPMQVASECLGPLGSGQMLDQMRHAGSRREALTLLLASPEFMRR